MTRFDVTVRHGVRPARYHTFQVEAADVGGALVAAADELPREVRDAGDLVEIRRAPDPDDRGRPGEPPSS
jgi:hypothetical protein